MTPAQWSEVLRTNLDGFYNTIQPLVFGMLARKSGRIIAIAPPLVKLARLARSTIPLPRPV